jgi:ribosomal subunit interface protein
MTAAYEFPVSFKCLHEECDVTFKDAAIDEVKKLSRFYAHIIDGAVVYDKKNPTVRVEVSVRIPGTVVTSVHEDFNRMAALDGAIEKAKTQIKKLKSRIVDHRGPHPAPTVEEEAGQNE